MKLYKSLAPSLRAVTFSVATLFALTSAKASADSYFYLCQSTNSRAAKPVINPNTRVQGIIASSTTSCPKGNRLIKLADGTILKIPTDAAIKTIASDTASQKVAALSGVAGPIGPQGLKGDVGPAGATGAVGPVGPKGDTGPQGPAGAKGSTGPQGIPGPAATPGAKGDKGEAGINGRSVLSGAVDPSAANGSDGDFYINTTTRALFGPKFGGVWGASVSIVGPQGSVGPQGIQGVPGIAGATGPKGDKGDKGDTGPQGSVGPAGSTGPQGIAGLTGAKGDTGAQGPKGDTGPAGGISTTTLACTDPVTVNGSTTGWAGCGPAGKSVELFCLTKGLPGRPATWSKTNIVSNTPIDEYDTISDRIRCSNVLVGSTVVACARCEGDVLPAIVEPSVFSYVIPGKYNWQVPKNAKSIMVEVVGAGGGGGSSDSGHGDGAGGGGGGYSSKFISNPTAGTMYSLIIGEGGIGGVGGGYGADGGFSQFSGPGLSQNGLKAYGGAGGATSDGGIRAGGKGGVPDQAGDTNIKGHDGEAFANVFPQGDGGVSGYVLSDLGTRCASYANKARCLEGFQDNNPGDNQHLSGADYIGHPLTQGDSNGSDGYAPGNGGSPSRGGRLSGKGGAGGVIITVGY